MADVLLLYDDTWLLLSFIKIEEYFYSLDSRQYISLKNHRSNFDDLPQFHNFLSSIKNIRLEPYCTQCAHTHFGHFSSTCANLMCSWNLWQGLNLYGKNGYRPPVFKSTRQVIITPLLLFIKKTYGMCTLYKLYKKPFCYIVN